MDLSFLSNIPGDLLALVLKQLPIASVMQHLLIPVIAWALTEVYKKLHPPKWLAPWIPYVGGVVGAFIDGLALGKPIELLFTDTATYIMAVLGGGAAVGAFNLKKSLSQFADWLLKWLSNRKTEKKLVAVPLNPVEIAKAPPLNIPAMPAPINSDAPLPALPVETGKTPQFPG
ncbi:MAG: hypothetical protein WC530_07965 [Candidatus Omnitrophota bacterium]|jgi:hypothetical protein